MATVLTISPCNDSKRWGVDRAKVDRLHKFRNFSIFFRRQPTFFRNIWVVPELTFFGPQIKAHYMGPKHRGILGGGWSRPLMLLPNFVGRTSLRLIIHKNDAPGKLKEESEEYPLIWKNWKKIHEACRDYFRPFPSCDFQWHALNDCKNS